MKGLWGWKRDYGLHRAYCFIPALFNTSINVRAAFVVNEGTGHYDSPKEENGQLVAHPFHDNVITYILNHTMLYDSLTDHSYTTGLVPRPPPQLMSLANDSCGWSKSFFRLVHWYLMH